MEQCGCCMIEEFHSPVLIFVFSFYFIQRTFWLERLIYVAWLYPDPSFSFL